MPNRQTAISELLENVQSQIQCTAESLHESVKQKGFGGMEIEHTTDVPGTGIFCRFFKEKITARFRVTVW
jgi:hypothetical protein